MQHDRRLCTYKRSVQREEMMAYSASDFLNDMSQLAQRIGIPQEVIDEPQMLACSLALHIGIAAGRRSLEGRQPADPFIQLMFNLERVITEYCAIPMEEPDAEGAGKINEAR